MTRALRLTMFCAFAAAPFFAWGQDATLRMQGEVQDPGHVFEEAGDAYDAGRYPEAATLYRSLLEAGYTDKAVLFNLGNAHFRNGDLGEAVLSYRRAWYGAPRDEDIRTNLGFALDHTGAVAPPATPAARLLRRLALAEWIVLAMASWWIAAALFALAVGAPRMRRTSVRILVLVVAVLLVSLFGVWQWVRLAEAEERVVVLVDQAARYAPLEEADAHFKLPPGSIVTTIERSGDWLRVGVGAQDGWIAAAACRPVHPGP